MGRDIINNDLVITGTLYVQGPFVLPAACVGDVQVTSGSPLGVTKTVHRYETVYSQNSNTNTVADRKIQFVGYSPLGGTIAQFQAGCVAQCTGTDTINVSLLKNNTVISTLNLNNAQTPYSTLIGSLSVSTITQGDVLEVLVTPSHVSGTLGQGVFAQIVLNENP